MSGRRAELEEREEGATRAREETIQAGSPGPHRHCHPHCHRHRHHCHCHCHCLVIVIVVIAFVIVVIVIVGIALYSSSSSLPHHHSVVAIKRQQGGSLVGFSMNKFCPLSGTQKACYEEYELAGWTLTRVEKKDLRPHRNTSLRCSLLKMASIGQRWNFIAIPFMINIFTKTSS